MFPLLQDVNILATGSQAVVEADGSARGRSFTTVTLEASPDEAQKVLAAREIGKVAAVLRAPGDKAMYPATRRDAMSLLGLGDAKAVRHDHAVPVLYGGAKGAR